MSSKAGFIDPGSQPLLEGPARVLLVDDHPANLLALEAVLGDTGYDLVKAASGKEALSHVKKQEFAVVLLEVQMPHLDGFATAKSIRSRKKSRHTPIIFLAGDDTGGPSIEEAYKMGAVDYLVKPVMPIILRAKVAVFVELFLKARQIEAQADLLRKAALERAADIQRFQAEASEVLASSLDYEETLAVVARLAVPWLADWCSVHVAKENGPPRQLAVAHVDPAKAEWAKQLGRRYPPDPESPLGVPKVIRSGEPELVAEITDDMLRAGTHDSDHLKIARGLGLKSLMIVPMNAHDRTLGAITFVSAESGRTYGPTDLALAEDLARRAAMALDNARLYREAQDALRDREETARQLGLLVEAAGGLTRSLELADVLTAVLNLSNRLIDAQAYAIWRLKPDGEHWQIAQSSGLSEKFRSTSTVRLPAAGMPHHPIIAGDLREIDYLADRQEAYRNEGIESMLSIPLRIHGQVSGTLTFYYKRMQHFSEITVNLASALANLATSAIESAELYERESRSRRRAEEADRRKDEFLATLAHELRNPLAPIRNSLQILKMRDNDQVTADRVRAMMERQVQHLVRLVDDLLDVSRVMRGKVELRREDTDLAEVISRAVETVQPLIDASGQHLSVSMTDEPLPMYADTVRLTQVIGNLLSNASKYSDSNGRIQLSIKREGTQAVVRLCDEGVGIAPEMLPRIFELFVQADHAATRAQGGLGIGLTLVKNLVALHDGTVEAFSEGVGKGSEFVVRLPLSAPTAVAGKKYKTRKESGESPSTVRRKVVVVDDNVDSAESLALLLRLSGHEVHVAYQGSAALDVVKSNRPEIVFLDLDMPDVDGFEVAHRIRQTRGLENVALVALTGLAQKDARRRTREAGFDHHLTKPADLDALHELLALHDKNHAAN